MLTSRILKNIAQKQSFFNSQSIKCFAKKITSSSINEGDKSTEIKMSNGDMMKVEHSFEDAIGLVGSCEISSIKYMAKTAGVPIEKIQVECSAEYDMDRYLGKSTQPNTFSFIDVETTITSSEKDKKKLEEAVEKGIKQCPMLSTLTLAGIKINKKTNYI